MKSKIYKMKVNLHKTKLKAAKKRTQKEWNDEKKIL